MLIFISLCLLCWGKFNEVRSEIRLEMYENSIDDMFRNCKGEMEEMFSGKFSHELTKEGYGTHWDNEKSNIKDDHILTKKELLAIRVYTENENKVYRMFNDAVRTEKDIYGTSFKFHILYFLLVSAVQKLKQADKMTKCYTTYRRYDREVKFNSDTGIIRLGGFASTSLTPYQEKYGKKTCLKIITCYGAAIEEYSAHPEEKEVLIPPYEMFQLPKEQDAEELKDCEASFVLKSVGIKSNLDCILVKK